MYINNVVLSGRAGRDPEYKEFNSGAQLAEISVAVRGTKKNDKGEYESDWFDLKIWGKTAETARDYLKKGMLFGVTGRLTQEKWQQEGQNRSKIVIDVKSLSLSPKSDSQPAQQEQAPAKKTEEESLDSIFGDEDEIPF